jgi:hypothetical protein
MTRTGGLAIVLSFTWTHVITAGQASAANPPARAWVSVDRGGFILEFEWETSRPPGFNHGEAVEFEIVVDNGYLPIHPRSHRLRRWLLP